MIEEGQRAPAFDLPAIVGGRPGRVSLGEFLGESVVVLAFYPADFNPSCTDDSTDLDEFDVFRMQSDAAVLAVSGDSVYSHRAFADAYDLTLPLLADVRGEVARAYGVGSDDGRYPNRRAVVVIDHDGRVTYTWAGTDIEDRPDIDAVQAAFGAVDDADLAETQYCEGYDRYGRSRERFVEGMHAYAHRDWVLARGAFEEAGEGLASAAEHFERAVRFSADGTEAAARRGERAVEEFRRALGLLSDAAAAHANGNESRGETLRREGEAALAAVRDLGPLPDPDALPVDSASLTGGDAPAPGPDIALEEDATPGRGRPMAGGGDEPVDPEEDLAALTAEIETQEIPEDGDDSTADHADDDSPAEEG